MKRFRFRFETVLNVRKRLENEALKALAEAQRVLAHEISRKEKLLTEISDSYKRVESYGESRIEIKGVEAFRLERDFIAGDKVRVMQVEQAIFRANRNVERAMRAYLTARRSTRTIEILREKDVEAFKKEMQVREQKESDEMTILRHRLRSQNFSRVAGE